LWPSLAAWSGEPPWTTIEVGTLTAEDGDLWLVPEIESFKRTHPQIHVRYSTVGTPSRNDIRIEDLPELALNVLGIISDRGNEVAYLTARDLIEPVEKFLPDPDFRFEDFFENCWDAVFYQGCHWGVPFMASSVAFILDWPLFQEAGIAEPPKTWGEVLDDARRLTKDTDGDAEIDQWGFRLGMRGKNDTHLFYLWLTMVLQKGGYLMRDGRFHLDHPALREAYHFLRELEDSGGATADNRKFRDVASDLSVRYAMQIAPSYQLNPLMKRHNYRIVLWPTFGKQVIADERRHYLAIGKSTPEKEAASWEFVKWVTRADAPHPDRSQFFQVSCRKDLLDRKDIQAKIGAWAKGFDAMHLTKGWNVVQGDPVMGRYEAMDHLETLITDLFHGHMGFDEAMARGEAECNAILLREARTNPVPEALSGAPTSEATGPEGLYQRAESSRRNQDFKQASLDYLRLWGLFPEKVARLHWERTIVACLKNAGLYIEAEALLSSTRPEAAAAVLSEDLQSSDPLAAAYRKATPDLEKLRSVNLSGGTPLEQAIFRHRLGCVEIHEEDKNTSPMETESQGLAESLKAATPHQAAVWAVCSTAIIDLILRQRTQSGPEGKLRGGFDLKSLEDRETARRLASAALAAGCSAALASARYDPLVFNALDIQMGLLRRLGETREAVTSCEEIVHRFERSILSPQYGLKAAHLWKEELMDLNLAVVACDKVALLNPKSEFSREALMTEGFWLYGAHRMDEAKVVFQKLLEGLPPGEDADTIQLVIGLCGAAPDGTKGHADALLEFTRSHPGHPLCPRVMLLLAAERLVQFDFEGAEALLREVQSEFPGTPSALEAGQGVLRLTSGLTGEN
jgi:ABC-type glycerol-3-phosphate transport system substrate-binding protein